MTGSGSLEQGDWKHLNEKALVDLVNGIEVVGEKLRFRQSRTGLGTQMLDALTGRNRQEVQQLFSALASGQSTIVDWLTMLQNSQTETDLALAKVARHTALLTNGLQNRLGKMEDGVLELSMDVQRLKEAALRSDTFHSQLFLENSANAHVRRVIDDAGESNGSAVIKIFYAVDALWWGPLGNLVRSSLTERRSTVQDMVINAQREIESLAREAFRKDLGSREDPLVDVKELMAEYRQRDKDSFAQVSFSTLGASETAAPLHFLMGSSEATDAFPMTIPARMTPKRIVGRMWSEAQLTANQRMQEGEPDEQA